MKILSKKFYILLFIALVMFAIKVSANESGTQQDARNALIEKYIQARDQYIKEFENQSIDADNKKNG